MHKYFLKKSPLLGNFRTVDDEDTDATYLTMPLDATCKTWFMSYILVHHLLLAEDPASLPSKYFLKPQTSTLSTLNELSATKARLLNVFDLLVFPL